MAFPRIEIYPRARPLTGDEDMVVSQGGVLRKASVDQIADYIGTSGGGSGTGTIPVWGDVSGLSTGDCVAVGSAGMLVKASNNDAAKMPCIGVFKAASGLDPAVVVVLGRDTIFTGLSAGVQYYVGLNGALTSTAPTASGTISQRVCKGSTTATSGVVQTGEPFFNT
jgi:hypothetical protein